MKHTMKLHDAPYDMIKSGRKTIELRLYDEKRRMISVGDEIEFLNSKNPDMALHCRVLNIHKFPSFGDLYKELPLLKCGYTEEDIATASPSDMDLYYSSDKQEKYGVIGIEIELFGGTGV